MMRSNLASFFFRRPSWPSLMNVSLSMVDALFPRTDCEDLAAGTGAGVVMGDGSGVTIGAATGTSAGLATGAAVGTEEVWSESIGAEIEASVGVSESDATAATGGSIGVVLSGCGTSVCGESWSIGKVYHSS